ncbi:MAG: c-type cytochrome [Gaiella sp.]
MARALVLLLLALALALGVAACGGDDEGGGGETTVTDTTGTETDEMGETDETGEEATDGAAVFASAGCGGCHTLAAADASGTVGPNLDDLQPDEATVAAMVRSGGGAMPSFEGDLSDEEITAVAVYVSSSAGG